MKHLLKKIIVRIFVDFPLNFFELYSKALGGLNFRLDDALRNSSSALIEKRRYAFSHSSTNGKSIDLVIFTPNALCYMRAKSFSYKEPETLEWIERFGGKDKVLFDIGANIGIYSIYNSLLHNSSCIAFEPSFFNLKQLTKNININKCENLISVVTNPLSDSLGFSDFLNGNIDEGGALSAFGVNYGYDGDTIQSKTNVLGCSLDKLFELKLIETKPNFIKIDVDGIEHLILNGALKVLSFDECKSVLIEVNDDFEKQAIEVSRILKNCGFKLEEKRHAEEFENNINFGRTYNQIWVK